MARGINKVIIVGNVGQHPETRTFPDGGMITNISVATSEQWKDKQTGQQQERTEWHRIIFNGRLAEIAHQYLKKGSKVYIEGSLRTRKWQDKQTGQDRYSTDIVAREMQMLDARETSDSQGYQQQPQQYQQQPQQQPQQRQQQQQGKAEPSPNANLPHTNQYQQQHAQPQPASFEDFDDDIPF